ncbi:helix-turn-helix transcriptional regulator [Tepidamorphus sp. 3E244]|uniref:helix-turn-helix transcriptional regulator n=1 Tax=Tepidamorphus sp. 3E244 TaxID=3385498 RepID=UPI0038FCBF36
MAKSDRFFEIIQILRQARKPLRARDIAELLEVSPRTVYRDIATLQAMQTPIHGEAGIGYVMRKGYDLPPINFDIDEAEAVAVGLAMVARTGDLGLWRAAQRASRKLNKTAPGTQRLVASSWGVAATAAVDMTTLRALIRAERKIDMAYDDASGAQTRRVVWPLALIYYTESVLLVGWCELRRDLRHFRLDRIANVTPLDDTFTGRSDDLIALWEDTQKRETVSTREL